MLTVPAADDLLATTPCRVLGLDDLGNAAHRAVAAALVHGFNHAATSLLIEPTLPHGRGRRVPDLVVIDPVAGFHVFEVKGHDLDAVTDVEAGGKLTLDYGGRATKTDPLVQSKDAMWAAVNAVGEFTPKKLTTTHEYWAVFPRIRRADWQAKWGKGTYEPTQLLFADDLDQPAMFADRLRATGEARLPPGCERHDAAEFALLHRVYGDREVLQPAVARPGRTVAPNKLGAKIDEVAAGYKSLSDEQQRLSETDFTTGPRLVRGVAGSGKTIVLANNLARRIARSESRTASLLIDEATRRPPRFLALCYNRTLAPLLQSRIQAAYAARMGGVPDTETLRVRHYHGLLSGLVRAGLLTGPPFDRNAEVQARQTRSWLDQLDHLQRTEPDRLARERFEAIYIDEAQDLEPDEFRLLAKLTQPREADSAAADPADATDTLPSLAIFYDEAQNLYARPRPTWSDLGINVVGRTSVMTTCYRNSRQIVEPAFNVLNGSYAKTRAAGAIAAFADRQTLRSRGLIEELDSDPRVRVRFTDRDTGAAIRVTRQPSPAAETDYLVDRIRHLLIEQQVRPHDLLVLAPNKYVIERVAARLVNLDLPDIGYRIASAEHHKDQLVAVTGFFSLCTVHSAKGYDAPVVIVAAADRFRTDTKARAAFYVACTRAQQYLEVTTASSTAPLVDELEAGIRDLKNESNAAATGT